MNFDRLPNLHTIATPQPIDRERIPVNDDTRGEAHHVDAVRAYQAQLRTNREATPVALYRVKESTEL